MTRPVALALRALGLGDFLTGLPALSLLKQALSDHSVVLAAPAVFAPLVPYVRAIDGLLPAGELMPLNRDYAGVDVAVDLHGKGPESRRLLADLQPGRLVAFADPAAGFAGSAVVSRRARGGALVSAGRHGAFTWRAFRGRPSSVGWMSRRPSSRRARGVSPRDWTQFKG